MRIEPLHDRVIIKRAEKAEGQSPGGIYIPEAAQDTPQEGVVVAVGPGKTVDGELQPIGLKAGDRVLFGKYAGADIKINGDAVLFMREDEILAIIHDE